MAKRQAMQFQTDLQTDDDFDKFIELHGLCVIDVYSDWCGPCTGMLGLLRKLKMEQGGELLNLATAKADTISYINRFYKKSEPTWLFVNQGRAVNIMFGANSPKFLKLIQEEIKLIGKLRERESFNITEMQPNEIERDNLKNAAKRANALKEQQENEQKKKDYFHYVTNAIGENLHDIGITIFGPHIHRDTYRHLIDYGMEKFGIQCKDRRNQAISKEQFEIINTVCENPISMEVIQALDGKEFFICFWKVPVELKELVPDYLQKFADDIKGPRVVIQQDEEDNSQPPRISDQRLKVEYELPADEECSVDDQPATPKDSKIHANASRDSTAKTEASAPPQPPPPAGAAAQEDATNETKEAEGVEEQQNKRESAAAAAATTAIEESKRASGFEFGSAEDEGERQQATTETNDEKSKKNICTKTLIVPAIWVPKDWRTHAALIYTFFRAQTSSFLPPDPVPEPPHVIMAFDTYKKRDLLEFAERNIKDIPLYGFFTSDEAEEAKFIANTKESYLLQRTTNTDKLVFKVNKCTSHTMLSLVTYGPTYVSPNTTIGAQEAKIFFPDDYVSAEQEMESKIKMEKSKGKEKEKGVGVAKQGRGSKDEAKEAERQAAEATVAAAAALEKGRHETNAEEAAAVLTQNELGATGEAKAEGAIGEGEAPKIADVPSPLEPPLEAAAVPENAEQTSPIQMTATETHEETPQPPQATTETEAGPAMEQPQPNETTVENAAVATTEQQQPAIETTTELPA